MSIQPNSITSFDFLKVLIILLFISCNKKETSLFELVSEDDTGIYFSNEIKEDDELNIIKEEYVYNGGGVAVGDFNNDGLQDIFFTGNMVNNKLYLNKGNMKFEDVTVEARVEGSGKWCSGVTLVDINQDGRLDIYVSVTLETDSINRGNLLYVNNGLNSQGTPVFTESASDWQIGDNGHTTQSAFFDFDNDGDLDLYLLTNIIDANIPTNYRNKITTGKALNNDRLYRNNGDGTFANVTKDAGIRYEGFGLGIAISDFNLDGWPDIYVANDYISNDLLYVNNQDGTFSNKIDEYIKHQSYSSMGTDIVDINNDGLVDIITLDMLPDVNQRKKQMLGPNNYITYINNDLYDFQHQYVRNSLQINNGLNAKGQMTFSEIGQYSGIYQTDWSWTPLVADFDNDGFKDIIITNGFPKDVTDRDFATYISGPAGTIASPISLHDSIPIVKISNFGFKNNGDLTFKDKTKDWGLKVPSFSNGAAYVDLDNDGDLDVIVNNINDKAFIYKNTLNDKNDNFENHFIRIKLQGLAPNLSGIGTKIKIHYKGKHQYYEHFPVRGYLSCVEDVAHFGLGSENFIDSIQVIWPDGKYDVLKDVQPNRVLTIKQSNSKNSERKVIVSDNALEHTVVFKESSNTHDIHFKHEEDDKIDFNQQKTLPHKFTQMGPGVAVGDINNDRLDDFYVGGSAGRKGTFFIQDENGQFQSSTENIQLPGGKYEEDMGSLFFDADNDGDEDLYVVSGSYEFQPGSKELQDRLYLNDGKGNFKLSEKLPQNFTSGSCVKAADFNGNGFLDLFVGGRIIPGQYPQPPSSSLYKNENGNFIDVTDEVCPELKSLGMVTDALWTDFDKDGAVDLIVVGEFLPVTFFKNSNGKLINATSSSGIADQVGWYNSISAADFDNDGDIDYAVGNLGLNTHYKASKEQPLSVYAKDFDNNESMDAILVNYIKNKEGEMLPYPMASRDDLISQMIHIRRKFPRYEDYGEATINEILSKEELGGALILHATNFASSYIENLGEGKFKMTPLPKEAQFAPVFGMLPDDIDSDGNMDLLLVGNNYGTEVFTGRYDAMIGLYLKGNGKGGFSSQPLGKSGFFVDGDAKGLAKLRSTNGEDLYIVTQNQDSLKVFSKTKVERMVTDIPLKSLDASAEIVFKDGQRRYKEFYYGDSYLSQSPRRLEISKDKVSEVVISDFLGNKRKVDIGSLKLASGSK